MKCPPELEHLIVWYEDLRAANQRGFSYEPLSFSEIAAYRDLYCLVIEGWEVDLMRMLDGLWQKSLPTMPSK